MCTGPCSARYFDPLRAQCAIIQRSALCELEPSSYTVGKNNTAAILAPVGRGAGVTLVTERGGSRGLAAPLASHVLCNYFSFATSMLCYAPLLLFTLVWSRDGNNLVVSVEQPHHVTT